MKYNIKIKTEEDIKRLRISGKRLAQVIQDVKAKALPGVTTGELNDYAYKLITDMGDEPAFLNYKPFGASYPYPGAICISVNNEVVHGIGGDYVLKEGDILKLDGGVKHKNLITDHAISFIVGGDDKGSPEDVELVKATKEALMAGIRASVNGNFVNDISRAIQAAIPNKYGIVKVLSGHGVGYKVHEEPYVPNFDDGVKGPKLVAGMVLAIEPMLNLGTDEVKLMEDDYTFVTADGKRSAHFEHTILITEDKPEILTIL